MSRLTCSSGASSETVGPPSSPQLASFRISFTKSAGHQGDLRLASAFIVGYLAVWCAFGLVAYAVLKAGLAGGIFAWDHSGQPMAVGALLATALYEMTPLKTRCLRKCRSPLGFFLSSWRDGLRGAFTMGTRHGAWCLGCCWALMVALFALGVTSLTWMLVVSGLIAAEKLLPWRAVATAVVSVVLVVLATGVAVAPASVPWLTVPARAAGMW